MIATIPRKKAAALLLALAFYLLGVQVAAAASLVKGLGGTSGYGTLAMGRNDDSSSSLIALGAAFPYGIKLYTGSFSDLYINNNGNLTFRSPLGTYTPTPFPVTNQPMLAAYWGDVDTRGSVSDPLQNNVYYSTAMEGKFIVTWNYVGYYSGGTDKLNAFQMIITDRSDVGQGDFDLEYRYEQLQWTTGSASGGSNGLGGTPAQMGYDAGDGKNYYRHPDSATANILALIQNSNVGEPGVWRFEVRGGTPNPVKTPNLVDVRLIETLNSADIEVDMASFATPPASVTSANGATRIEWFFAAFPANVTKDLGFDVMFKSPKAGERRQLVAKLELLYKDVNGNPVRSELGPEYIAVLPSIYQVTPATDKPVYGPNEPVLISSLVRNLSAFPANVAARISVLDAGNVLVANVGTTAAQLVGAGGNTLFGGMLFQTSGLYAGSYRLLAEVLDTNGAVVASGTAAFDIATGAGQQAAAAITTDKQVYGPFDRVRVSDRISNALPNASLDAVRVTTVVANPDGSERLRKVEPLLQLAPSAVKDFAYTLQLAASPAGQYNATLTVTRADGTLLAQASTQFRVDSSDESGAGLTGMLTASPATAHNGQPVKLAFGVTNGGNAAINNLPLTVSIVDPENQTVVASYPYVANLAVGASHPGTAEWTAIGSESGSYVAVMGATIGGKMLTLAQQPVKVLTLETSSRTGLASRVLALVSCKDDEEAQHDQACLTTRAQTIGAVLDAAGVAHAVTTNESVFRLGLRSGQYNTYWLSGKQDRLHEGLAKELREAVFGGEGALIDSEHDQRNGGLDTMAGIRWRGKFGPTDLTVELGGQLFPVERLQTVGRAGRFDLAGGTEQGVFEAGVSEGGAPAIVSNQFGSGRVVQFVFDIPSSVPVQTRWQPVVHMALQYLLRPHTDKLPAGAIVPVSLKVTNAGPETPVLVSSVLPAGARFLDAGVQGSYDADTRSITWPLHLAPRQVWDSNLTFALPVTPGTYSVHTTVSTIDPFGVAAPYGAPMALTFRVANAAAEAASAIALLDGLTALSKQDAELRDRLVEQVRGAMAAYELGTVDGFDAAIAQLIGVIDQLDELSDADTRPAHDRLNRTIREAQRRWSEAMVK